MSLVIVAIPAYNEEADLKMTIDRIRSVMSKTPYRYEILVQDDGSQDRTLEIAKEAADHVEKNGSRLGLAQTFRNLMRKSIDLGADIVVHTDADGQYPADSIPVLISKIEEGHDLALGSRFLGGIRYGNEKHKALSNIVFASIVSMLAGRRITDATSGFRAMNRKVARSIDIRSRHTYTYDQYIQASMRGYKIVEIPITGSRTRESRLIKSGLHHTAMIARDIWNNYGYWKAAAKYPDKMSI